MESVILLCERAVYATAQARTAECSLCREDFQSTFDILEMYLDDPDQPITRADLVGALSWMKLSQLDGPDGSVLITDEDVFVKQNGQSAQSISDGAIGLVGNAVWVGLNKFLHPLNR